MWCWQKLRFGFFWPPTPLRLHFLWYKSLQKVNFFDHLPTSSRKRSLWTAPCSFWSNWALDVFSTSKWPSAVKFCEKYICSWGKNERKMAKLEGCLFWTDSDYSCLITTCGLYFFNPFLKAIFFFQGCFSPKFCPYVQLIFKRGL